MKKYNIIYIAIIIAIYTMIDPFSYRVFRDWKTSNMTLTPVYRLRHVHKSESPESEKKVYKTRAEHAHVY